MSTTRLTVLTGPTVPLPAPPLLLENLERVEVSTSDSARSGFQLGFAAGRAGRAGAMDFPLLSLPLLKPFHRVVLLITFDGRPSVLLDGIVTHRELTPGTTPGSTRLTVTGEDVSVMMRLEEKCVEHPAQSEPVVAQKLILSYARYGMVPVVVPPPVLDVPLPVERVPLQRGTDLDHLTGTAARFGYVFYVTPGPAPLTNTAYWGPPVRAGLPQPALSVDMGAQTNVTSLTFRNNATTPTRVVGTVQDRTTGRAVPVRSTGSLRPPLSAAPDWQAHAGNLRTTLLRDGGTSTAGALARAQGDADASGDSVTATGSLDTLRYGHLLAARRLVGLRGAGWLHDGLYYVREVTHLITRESYVQSFTLTRDGVGATVTVVPT
ncbi:hypothetical protein ACH4SP_00085 [Streptomyces sp. NPDC021093]|uniref:hypothetical protein n=1 Tax=Streptomyces sp. NPDC021093 TaxID=3365112 RepID=UPI0037A4503C